MTVPEIERIKREGISIHTALAGCDLVLHTFKYLSLLISIHTALAGCDQVLADYFFINVKFQSTQPSQAVTGQPADLATRWTFQSTQPSQAVTYDGKI